MCALCGSVSINSNHFPQQHEPLRLKFDLNYIQILGPYRAVNTACVPYKEQSVNAV
jgi:hypothetical protein